jgi:hypothetical protein
LQSILARNCKPLASLSSWAPRTHRTCHGSLSTWGVLQRWTPV